MATARATMTDTAPIMRQVSVRMVARIWAQSAATPSLGLCRCQSGGLFLRATTAFKESLHQMVGGGVFVRVVLYSR